MSEQPTKSPKTEETDERARLRAMARAALERATRPGDRVQILKGELTGHVGTVTVLHHIDDAPSFAGVTVHFDHLPGPDERDLFYSHGEYQRLPRDGETQSDE